MLAVRGVFEKGRARPISDIQGREGQSVIITFVEESDAAASSVQADAEHAWQDMMQLVESCAVATGIPDLAQRHDAYLHHTPAEG